MRWEQKCRWSYLGSNNLSVFMPSVQLDYFIVSETKLKNTFPSTQFMFTDYETRVR